MSNTKKEKNLVRRSNLSPAKRMLLEKRLRGEVESDTPLNRIPRRSSIGSAPLSFAQQRLWFLHQLEPESSSYNEVRNVWLRGLLDVASLEQSLNEIVQRHESLRTTFETVEGLPVQVIASVPTLSLLVVNLCELPEAERNREVQRLATELSQRPFNLVQGPLLRLTLLHVNKQDYVLLINAHHIVFDGWSWDVFFRELVALYEAFSQGKPSPLPELPIQYADFALWQRQWLQGEVLEVQLGYWKQKLSDLPPMLQLPTDRPRPLIQTFRGARKYFSLTNDLTEALEALSRHEDATLFMTLLAAFKTLLYRYTGSENIVVGTPIANRNRAEIEALIGYFVNTLVLCTDLSCNMTFRELLHRVREVTLGAYAHQDLPFEQLVEELRPQRNLNHSPLFQVMFVLHNAPISQIELSGLTLSTIENNSSTAKFDLTLSMQETGSGLMGILEYNTDLFEASTITRMAGHWQRLLEAVAVNPDRRLIELPLLTQPERHQLLMEWNDTEVGYSQQQCIHQLFEATVERSPDTIAVVFEEQQLTYRELNAKANQLARYLQKLGVGPEVLVGICVERSLDMIIGLLGILKAGGAYLPLDPTYPKERLAFMLEDAQVRILLTQARLLETLPPHQAQVLCLDTDGEMLADRSQENPSSGVTTDNLAYVIYTSGSTGQPKGVQIPHSALVNFLSAMRQTPGLSEEDILLSVTTLSFDIAALELYLPLIVGACLVVVSREVAADGSQLLQQLASCSATVMQATPATWRLLLAAGWQSHRPLKILCGGEALDYSLADRLLERGTELWNLYGPTETTIWSAVHKVELQKSAESQNGFVCIGRPIANTQFYILDQYMQPVPVGVSGELHIGGVGLARGYLNRPELNAQKFIPNPFSIQEKAENRRQKAEGSVQNPKSKIQNPKLSRLYKTGDLARYLPDGNIEFLGRIDNQVKVRGFRIELGEIESVLSQYPRVREAVVAAREDEQGSKCLVAYTVFEPEQTPTITELRRFLEEKLPSYMVPSAFVPLDALPLTPNGKVDRKALPAPEALRPELDVAYVMPQTEAEEAIAKVWQKALKIEKIGIHDNFFELGGHSLLLVQVNSQLRELFNTNLSLIEMFRYPTISALAEYFSQTRNQKSSLLEEDIQTEKVKAAKIQQQKRRQKMQSQ